MADNRHSGADGDDRGADGLEAGEASTSALDSSAVSTVETGHRSPMQAVENTLPAQHMQWGSYSIPRVSESRKKCKHADSSSDDDSDESSDWASDDSDAEEHEVEETPTEASGYVRFDPTAADKEGEWRLPEALKAYWVKQVSKEMDKKHRKAMREDVPAPKLPGVTPPKVDESFKDMLEAGARAALKPADKSLSAVHESVTAVMGPLGSMWLALEEMRAGSQIPDPAQLLRWTEMSVCFVAQAVWGLTNRRRLIWLAKFLNDFARAGDILKEAAPALAKSKDKLFGNKFLKDLYGKAKGRKEARLIKTVLGSRKRARQNRQSQPFWTGPPRQQFAGSAWRGRNFGMARGQHQQRQEGGVPGRGRGQTRGAGRGGRGGRQEHQARYVWGVGSWGAWGGNPGKSEVSAKEVVGLGETKQTTRRAGKRSRSDRAAPLGRGKRTPMGVVGDSGRSSRRSNSTVSRELEGDYIRPRDSGNGPGGEVGLRGTATVRETQTGGAQVQQQGKGDVRCRDRGTDSEESHRTSGVPGTGILRPSVSQAKEGWLHEAGLQPETVEQVPEVSTLQNGKHGIGHHLDPEDGLVHQDRPQRCVLDGTGMSGRQEVPSICMERASVAVSSPGVWTGFGAPVFHQTDETGGGVIKEDWHEVDVIFGRCSGDESDSGDGFARQGLNAVPVTEAGLHNQLEEVGIAAQTNHGISGVLGELDGYDAVITSEQDIGYPLALPGYDSLFFGLSETTDEIDWEVDSNSFSHHSRPVVLQATSDVEDQGTVEGTAELRSDTHIDSGMQDRAGMVDRIPGNLQWSIVHCSEPGHDNNVGCLESWVGSGDREQQHAGSLVARREQLPYQPIGVTSCGTRAPSIHKEQDADASALTVRQQDGRCLSEQARRNTVVTANPRDERRLGILHATEDHNYCGISAGEVELPGGSREQSVSGQQQLAIGYSDLCSAPITMGDHDHGFIRRSIEHATESVCELEAGPISEGDGCILIHVGGLMYAFPPFCLVSRCLAKLTKDKGSWC